MNTTITLIQDDITLIPVDGIVNDANHTLTGGGGVDGAIHKAAGPELLAECLTLRGCQTGQAKITSGYLLPAKWVIHTVGPVWQGGQDNESRYLAECYQHCLSLADKHGLKSIAFPGISCGVFGFPVDQACRIAVDTITAYIAGDTELEHIILCAFSDEVHQHWLSTLSHSQYH